MAELVYPPVIAAARTMFKALDLRLDISGSEHVPTSGGAVLVSNHIGYLDFVFAGFAARPSKRLVRFMAKDSVFRHKVSGPLMRGMKHIPVDRKQGEHAFRHALESLRSGEIVGVFPEATISPSFTLKKFKSGAVRMAQEAQVPVLPVALWGTQRVWTKGRKRDLRRRHYPITIRIGKPMTADPAESAVTLTERLRERMQELLESAQAAYPEGPRGPEDTWWLPAHLGGTAPAPKHT
ncbi:1-acyl-sn-glycerol-3-phosphate acyltransferase [Streptomyces carpaticus]|uniref:1-acyl-sn-glycerol-3-phosphate acyltransferases n=2 Tax=Streptomyces TaxID=1883 RepID=A0A1I6VFY5_9ACTN|nr:MULTISPECIES: lysophospholipid acyltransferase family protein [Streptomyces]MCK1816258.1 1-acyl-sn-glycerol-3-phosphate acyltransferase [Streptomyces sp. XM4011]QKV67360.1 1-acyl-sn-glycerol-3-phosphate acyltransferase [Streptomyces harbinensis]UWM47535.1 1-acyl-sn-glycerol-3-phosphate acyltransferase [Streptomyces carpaticus]SFT12547.1 1-acyl-sn-glycerol-3-phosphate acyltransferases [Streptomyces harbinensis]